MSAPAITAVDSNQQDLPKGNALNHSKSIKTTQFPWAKVALTIAVAAGVLLLLADVSLYSLAFFPKENAAGSRFVAATSTRGVLSVDARLISAVNKEIYSLIEETGPSFYMTHTELDIFLRSRGALQSHGKMHASDAWYHASMLMHEV